MPSACSIKTASMKLRLLFSIHADNINKIALTDNAYEDVCQIWFKNIFEEPKNDSREMIIINDPVSQTENRCRSKVDLLFIRIF